MIKENSLLLGPEHQQSRNEGPIQIARAFIIFPKSISPFEGLNVYDSGLVKMCVAFTGHLQKAL